MKYLKIPFVDRTIYFKVDIDSYHAYSAHGIDWKDYHVKINDMNIYEKEVNFDDTYGGLFLIIDDKEIKIYDTIQNKTIEIEKNNDVRGITYYYDNNEYTGVSLDFVIKEILFNQICVYL
jgi:hypothetical protein